MGINLKEFGALLLQFLPFGLKAAGVPDELNATITHAAVEAQQIHGAGSGPAKLAHVQSILADSLDVTNAIRASKGKAPLPTESIQDAVTTGIAAGVKAAKAIHEAHAAGPGTTDVVAGQ